MFGGVKKEEYEAVVKANNELRMKMEKLRLENALLKDQIRVVTNLEPEQSMVYVAVQSARSATLDDIKNSPKTSNLSDGEIEAGIDALVEKKLIDAIESNGEVRYSIRTPDATGGWMTEKDMKK